MDIQKLIEVINSEIEGAVMLAENCSPEGVTVPYHELKAVCQILHSKEEFYFDMLSCITGIDNGAEINTMEVIYNLYSIPYDQSLMLKVILNRERPEIDSVMEIWRTADWHERETYDLFGIVFTGHPDLRRILLPADWEGHPLRKDYKHQEYYRGIKVEY